MTLPDKLLRAISYVATDAEDAHRLARAWQATLPRMEAAAARIRAQVATSQCRCQRPAQVVDGHCTRCYGRRSV
jgi:hypothetical protein